MVVTTLILEGWSCKLDPRHSVLTQVGPLAACGCLPVSPGVCQSCCLDVSLAASWTPATASSPRWGPSLRVGACLSVKVSVSLAGWMLVWLHPSLRVPACLPACLSVSHSGQSDVSMFAGWHLHRTSACQSAQPGQLQSCMFVAEALVIGGWSLFSHNNPESDGTLPASAEHVRPGQLRSCMLVAYAPVIKGWSPIQSLFLQNNLERDNSTVLYLPPLKLL